MGAVGGVAHGDWWGGVRDVCGEGSGGVAGGVGNGVGGVGPRWELYNLV